MTETVCWFYFSTFQLFLFLVPLSPTRFPFLSIPPQGVTLATILRQFLLFTVTYISVCTLQRVASISGRWYYRAYQISLSVADVSSFSLPLPPPPECFIVVQLLFYRHCGWPSFSVASISNLLHFQLIVASSRVLNFTVLLHFCLCFRRSPPPVFALLSLLPPFPASNRTGPPFFRLLLRALALTGIHHWMIALPLPPYWYTRTPYQGFSLYFSPCSLLRLSFWRYKDTNRRGLTGVCSNITSTGSALRGPCLGGRTTLFSSWLPFPIASLRIYFQFRLLLGQPRFC